MVKFTRWTGTLDELIEMVTWQQIGYHSKGVGLLDTLSFFQPLLRFFEHAREEGFVPQQCMDIVRVDADCSKLIDALEQYRPPTSPVLEAKGRA